MRYYVPFAEGLFGSPSLGTGGLSAPSRNQGLLIWCSRTLTSCSCSSKPFWFNALALSSYPLLARGRELPNVRRATGAHAIQPAVMVAIGGVWRTALVGAPASCTASRRNT